MSADLWTFATTLYARPGVEAACLELQAAGADVCLVLCGLWLDSRGVAHDPHREAQLRSIAEPWQREVVKPLRAMRQAWRNEASHDSALAGLREQVKKLELDAERQQMMRLQALSTDWPVSSCDQPRAWLNALAPSDTTTAHGASDILYAAR
ncbi:TIGR02444 family protein [Pseudomonas sp. D1-3]|uniref:TIGR02444 family protein n=1 Tax=Phytopseudomonas argentinensis TaxID=289370 RepID=UPI0008A916A5|nr:TIGR02444 family protein [Pseudomonas argentinensis]